MDESFVRERITQLRLRKGVSEYRMSYDLGHSRGYVHNISSGKALPPMKEFFAICDYFGLTPQQFFDEGTQNPELIQKAVAGMKQLDETDLLMLLGLINRLLEINSKPPVESFSAGGLGFMRFIQLRSTRKRLRC